MSKNAKTPDIEYFMPELLGRLFWVCRDCRIPFPSNPHPCALCDRCVEARVERMMEEELRMPRCPMGENRCE